MRAPTLVRFPSPLELRVSVRLPSRCVSAHVVRISLALAITLSSRLAAQAADAPVPHDLAEAFARSLANADSQSAVEFASGRIPASIESSVHLPAAARLLGTVTVGRTSFVMATTSLTPDSILHVVAHDYGASHWEGLEAVRVTGNATMGGFRPARPAFPSTFCHDSVEVIANAARADAQTTTVRLRVNRGPNPCARIPNLARTTGAPPPRPATTLTLPMLYDPPGASFASQCIVSSNSSSTQTQLGTTMELAALIEHYGKQLEAQGWAPTTIEAPIIRKLWSRRDSSGVASMATLSIGVSPLAPMCRDASLSISTSNAR